MQAPKRSNQRQIGRRVYNADVARKLTKTRPEQGSRLVELRKAAGLTQAELADLVAETQQNIAYWEQSERPPRSDVLPKMAEVLGVRIEDLLLSTEPIRRKAGPVGRVQKAFDEVSGLPRRHQNRIVEVVSALVDQYKRSGT